MRVVDMMERYRGEALPLAAKGSFIPDWFQYFNPRIPIWQDTPPGVGIGQEIGVYVRYYNSASVVQNMTAYVYIRDPDGIEIGRKEPAAVAIAAHGNSGTIITTTATYKIGAYTARAILYADGIEVDTWEGRIATVGEEEISGKLYPERFYYWNSESQDWQMGTPPKNIVIAEGGAVGIQADGRNEGTGMQLMTLEVKIKNPRGKVIKTEKPLATQTKPGRFCQPTVASVMATMTGTYTAEIKLFADSRVLDSWSGMIASIKEITRPEYRLIQHTVYPGADTYYGDAEECTFEFKLTPEQVPGTAWVGIRIANAFAREIEKQHATMLDLKVYEDTSPALWTNYRVIATATAPSSISGMGAVLAVQIVWVIVIGAVLVAVLIAATFFIKEIRYLIWGKPALKYGYISVSAVDAKTGDPLIVPFQIDSGSEKTPWGPEKYLAGTYTVTWGSITGYLSPDPSSWIVTVVEGQPNPVIGKYWPEWAGPRPTTGTLFITTSPSGAPVYVDTMSGKTPWTLTLEKGNYVVTFGNIEGYEAPEPVSITVAAADEVKVSRIYKPIRVIPWKWIGIGMAVFGATILAVIFVPRAK